MKKNIFKLALILLAALLVIQLLRVQLRKEPSPPSPEGMSRVSAEEIKRRNVRKKYRYSSKMEGIKQVQLYPPVPGIVKEKLLQAGEAVEEDGAVLLIDRYEEGVEYEYSRVRSPVSGRVMEFIPDTGQRVWPQHPVAVVADTSRMKITLHVPEEEAVLINRGDSALVKVKALEDKTFRGQVSKVEPALDRLSMRRKIQIKVDNPQGKLRPSMVCNVDIVVEELEEVKTVPAEAVVQREESEGIFIVDEDSTARWKKAEVLLRGREYIAVEGDFESGEKVVSGGHYGLVPDRKVEIVE